MKILFINTRHYPGGGDSTYTFNLASLMKENGHELSFFAMQDDRNIPDQNNDLFISPIDFRELNKKKNIRNGLYVLSRSIYSHEARKKFSQLLDRVKPDVIHAQNLHGHITPSVLFEAKSRNLPIVWTLHDYKMICPNTHFLNDTKGAICEDCKNGRFYMAIKNCCKKGSLMASSMASLEAYFHSLLHIRDLVDIFISPSEFLKSKLLENGFPNKKVEHVPLFLKNDQFLFNKSDEGFFLFLGKIEKIKGIENLIQAAKQMPNIKFKIAGQVLDLFGEKVVTNLPANVEYLGVKSGDGLKELLNNARAIILPSLWYENQPFVILEAFAAGKPVIASDLGGMRELIGNNERGILVHAGDTEELSNAITQLSSNQEIYSKLARNAFNYVKTVHNQENHLNKISNIYERLLVSH